MRVLVTGGAGFIGSHIVDALVARGDVPIVLDDLSTGSDRNVPNDIERISLDVASADLVAVTAEIRPDAIVHAAAQASVPRSMADPDRDRAVNLIGTHHLIEGAKRARVKRLVFISTGGGIYGESDLPATEASIPRPKSFYSVHKYAAERYVEFSGLGYAIARLSNVYGPRQSSHLEGGVLAIFAERLIHGQPITIYGSGEQVRDYIHASDVSEAILRMLESDVNGLWNVASGTETTVNSLLDVMQRVIRPAIDVTHTEQRVGDVFSSRMSSGKIERDFGWRHSLSLEDGIRTLAPDGIA